MGLIRSIQKELEYGKILPLGAVVLIARGLVLSVGAVIDIMERWEKDAPNSVYQKIGERAEIRGIWLPLLLLLYPILLVAGFCADHVDGWSNSYLAAISVLDDKYEPSGNRQSGGIEEIG